MMLILLFLYGLGLKVLQSICPEHQFDSILRLHHVYLTFFAASSSSYTFAPPLVPFV
jgi:hypothetical protein